MNQKPFRSAPGLAIRQSLLIATGAFALAGCAPSTTSPSPPGGTWGQVVQCLQRHPLLAVFDSQSGDKPSSHTKAVAVWQDIHGVELGYVGDNALGADDVTGSGDANVNQTAGPIHFGFTPSASRQNRFDIEQCVHAAYPVTHAAADRTRVVPVAATPARAPAPAPCLRSDGPGLRPYEHCGAGPAASGTPPAVAQSSTVCRLLYNQWQAGSQDALVQYGQDGCDQSPAPIPGSCASGEVDVPVLGGCVSQATADENCSTGRYSESAGGCATPGDTTAP